MGFRDIFAILTGMAGGLALFLFGMNVMSDALARMAGGRLERVIDKITANRYTAYLFGLILTGIVQSSSATTVLTVGLVNSGIMQLSQAVGIVLGANLGTTATAWLLSLNAIEGTSLVMELIKPSSFSPFLAIMGVGITIFAKSDKKRNVGLILLGFSVMMIGMNMMSGSVAPLKNIPAFKNTLTSFSNPFIGFAFALLFTLVIQSSDATVGILQALAMSVGVTYGIAIPLVCGAQLGTCITAIISSTSTNNNGKRTALIHLFYNLMKTLPFLLAFYGLNSVLHFGFLTEDAGAVGVAAFHSLLNVGATIVILPVSGILVRMAERTIPYNEEEQQERANVLSILDPILLMTPSFALEQADQAVQRLADTVEEAFMAFMGVEENCTDENVAQVHLLGKRIDAYTRQIEEYLMKISERRISEEDAGRVTQIGGACTGFAQIGKQIGETADLYIQMMKDQNQLTDQAIRDLKVLTEAMQDVISAVSMEYSAGNPRIARTVQIFHEVIFDLNAKVTKRHHVRLHSGICNPEHSGPFVDVCYGFERIVDRCDNIASAMLLGSRQKLDPAAVGVITDEERAKIMLLFQDKYAQLEK